MRLGRYKGSRGDVQTIRQGIIALLSKEEMSARELSQAIGIREKEVYEHLSHIARSVAAQRKKLIIRPCSCLGCGYVFQDRQRFTRPSRCPQCKGSHIQGATYRVD
jgi:predicted Zn-ribbon and HTH transcriptional regulator